MAATVRGISIEGRTGSFGIDATREYTLVYKVVTDNRNDGAEVVRDAVGIPALGSVYSAGNDFDASAVCSDKSVSQGDSPFEWEVECTFGTVADQEYTGQDNPLLEPAQITYGFQARQVIARGFYSSPSAPQANGDYEKSAVNSAGAPFDPPPMMEVQEPVLSIVRNVSSINPAGLMALANAVNGSVYLGADARQLRMNAPQAVRKWHQSVGFYWQVSYGMSYRWETWDIQGLNKGPYYLDSNGKKTTFITTGEGIPYMGDLTSTGGENTTSTPTFTRLRVYREIDFNSLGLI